MVKHGDWNRVCVCVSMKGQHFGGVRAFTYGVRLKENEENLHMVICYEKEAKSKDGGERNI